MVVRIRLALHGHQNRPFYRIAVADSTRAPTKKFLEHIGTYDPIPNRFGAKKIRVNLPRLKYWIAVGAQPSDTVSRLASKIHVTPTPPYQSTLEADPNVIRAMSALELKSLSKEAARPNARRTVEETYNEKDRPSPLLPPIPESELVHYSLSNPVDWPHLTNIQLIGIDADIPNERVFHFIQTILGHQPLNFLLDPQSKPPRAEFSVPNAILESTLKKFEGKTWTDGKEKYEVKTQLTASAKAEYDTWKRREARLKAIADARNPPAPQSASAVNGVFQPVPNPRSIAGSHNIPVAHILPNKITADIWSRLRAAKTNQVKIEK